MRKGAGLGMPQTMLLGFALLAIFALGFVYVSPMINFTPTTYSVAQGGGTGATVLVSGGNCGDDATGQFRPALFNTLNTSATEFISASVRVYEIVETNENYVGSLTSQTSGVQARDAGSGVIKIPCNNNDGSIKKYVAYIESTDASHTSLRYEFTAAEDIPVELALPQQGALIFKVYDEENHGYLYAGAETTAGGVQNSGTSFYSTTSNVSEYSVTTNGYFNYNLYVQTNSTAATDTQYQDKSLLVIVDEADLSDWEEVSITPVGFVATFTKLSNCPSKIANDGYDYCYEATNGNGDPLSIVDQPRKINVYGKSKSAVDPTDNINVGFATRGYFKETIGSGMRIDYNKDDSSQTYVYTAQYVTLRFA